MLTEDKQVYEDALRGRDASITQLKGTIQGAIAATVKTMNRLGVDSGEEVKEEPEDKLNRLVYHLSALAHDGSLAYNQPLDLAVSKEEVQDKFFTYWVGGTLNNTIIGYKIADGIRQISAPDIDNSRWYSCQMNYRTIF